jgi:hypothetical protein
MQEKLQWLNKSSTHIIAIILLFLITIPTGAFVLSRFSTYTFNEIVNLLSASGTITLSAILAYLYSKMWSTQDDRTSIHESQEEILKKQAQIQENQHDLEEIERRHILDVIDVDLCQNSFVLEVKNYGHCCVTEIRIVTQIQPDKDEFDSEETSTLLKKAGAESGKIVGPKEQVTMRAVPEFSIGNDNRTERGNFAEITTYLDRKNVENANLILRLASADEFGNISEDGYRIEEDIHIHGNMSLEEIE